MANTSPDHYTRIRLDSARIDLEKQTCEQVWTTLCLRECLPHTHIHNFWYERLCVFVITPEQNMLLDIHVYLQCVGLEEATVHASVLLESEPINNSTE